MLGKPAVPPALHKRSPERSVKSSYAMDKNKVQGKNIALKYQWQTEID